MIRRRKFDLHSAQAIALANSGSWDRWCDCGRLCMPLDWDSPVITENNVRHSVCCCYVLDPDDE